MRKKHIIFFLSIVVGFWNIIALFYIFRNKKSNRLEPILILEPEDKLILSNKLKEIAESIQSQNNDFESLLMKAEKLNNIKNKQHIIKSSIKHEEPYTFRNNDTAIAVIMIACNRPDALRLSLNQLIELRPSAERFPIVVSQDCNHAPTENIAISFKNHIKHFIKQPDQSPIDGLKPKEKKLEGYYKISRHYKWAFTQVFDTLGYKAAIIIEDDLSIAKDFFEYMEALYPILKRDPSLYCVSAWNDNGKESLIDSKLNSGIYRTDFFPGLGWMITNDLWHEFRDKWPKGFWDDWLRQPEQRKDRQCIRPEIPRTEISFHGKKGVSKGQFFDKHLKFIKMNTKFFEFKKLDVSFLLQENYDSYFLKKVYDLPLVSVDDVKNNRRPNDSEVRIGYITKNDFKKLAKQMNIMDDFKSGIPRTAYKGIITFILYNKRVYFSPQYSWSKYDTSWT